MLYERVIERTINSINTVYITQWENKVTKILFTDLTLNNDYDYLAVYKKVGSNNAYQIPMNNNYVWLDNYITQNVGEYKLSVVAINDSDKTVISPMTRIIVEAGVYDPDADTVTLPEPLENKYNELLGLIALVEEKLAEGDFQGETGNGIQSCSVDNYCLTLHFTDGTSYTTPSLRGATGSQGIQGVQGERGLQGEQGPAGPSYDDTNIQRRLTNLEEAARGNIYRYDTDDTEAYTKAIAEDVCPWASLDKLGGKSVVLNQLIKTTKIEGTFTLSNSMESGWIAQGVCDLYNAEANTYAGHKYYGKWECSTPNVIPKFSFSGQNAKDIITLTNASVPSSGTYQGKLGIQLNAIGSVDSGTYTYKYNLYDLTQMGLADITLAEAQEIFTDYIPYNSGELVSANVDKVISKSQDGDTIAEYTLPTLTLRSCGSIHDYVDYNNKKVVRRVGVATYDGTETWRTYGSLPLTRIDKMTNISSFSYGSTPERITSNYGTNNSDSNTDTNGGITIHAPSGFYWLIYHEALTPEEMVAKLQVKPMVVYYPLATPTEEDITEWDNAIQVEANGTITFHHDLLPKVKVPNEETFVVRLGD